MKRIVVVLGLLLVAACVPVKPPEAPPPMTEPPSSGPTCPNGVGDMTVLRPDASSVSTGTPTAVGAGSLHACVNDQSDSTYIDLDSGDTVHLFFPEEPSGATAWTDATLTVRVARPAGNDELSVIEVIADSGTLLSSINNAITTTPTNYTFELTSVPMTAADIQSVFVSLSQLGTSDVRVYEVSLDVTTNVDWSVGTIPVGF